jgi:hypothetical protein
MWIAVRVMLRLSDMTILVEATQDAIYREDSIAADYDGEFTHVHIKSIYN